jgi:hypothetical protein
VQRTGGLDAEGAQQLIDLLAADTPAKHVRVVLDYHRRRGVPFSEAWSSALRSIPRKDADVDDWRGALRWSREAWRECYEADALGVPAAA